MNIYESIFVDGFQKSGKNYKTNIIMAIKTVRYISNQVQA